MRLLPFLLISMAIAACGGQRSPGTPLAEFQDLQVAIQVEEYAGGAIWASLALKSYVPDSPDSEDCPTLNPSEIAATVAGQQLELMNPGGIDFYAVFGTTCDWPIFSVEVKEGPNLADEAVTAVVVADDSRTISLEVSSMFAERGVTFTGPYAPGAEFQLEWSPATDIWRQPSVAFSEDSDVTEAWADIHEVREGWLTATYPSELEDPDYVFVASGVEGSVSSCPSDVVCTFEPEDWWESAWDDYAPQE